MRSAVQSCQGGERGASRSGSCLILGDDGGGVAWVVSKSSERVGRSSPSYWGVVKCSGLSSLDRMGERGVGVLGPQVGDVVSRSDAYMCES